MPPRSPRTHDSFHRTLKTQRVFKLSANRKCSLPYALARVGHPPQHIVLSPRIAVRDCDRREGGWYCKKKENAPRLKLAFVISSDKS